MQDQADSSETRFDAAELSARGLRYARAFTAELVLQLGVQVRGVVVFGSCARGDARLGSDIDMVVVTDPRDSKSSVAITATYLALRDGREEQELLSAALNPLPSVVEFSAEAFAEHPWLLVDVATDGIVLRDTADGFIVNHLEQVKARLRAYGSYRVDAPDGSWFWELKPGMRPGEEIRI